MRVLMRGVGVAALLLISLEIVLQLASFVGRSALAPVDEEARAADEIAILCVGDRCSRCGPTS